MVRLVCNSFGTNCYYTSTSRWQHWGRWLLLGLVVVAFVLAIILTGVAMSRRRARRGHAPVYGFAWSTPNPFKNHPQGDIHQVPPQAYPPQDSRAMVDPESHIQHPQKAYYPNGDSYKGSSPVFEERSEDSYGHNGSGAYEREYYPPPPRSGRKLY